MKSFLKKGFFLGLAGLLFGSWVGVKTSRAASQSLPVVPHNFVGCSHYDAYLHYAQTFADTFLRAATDHWGPRKTPLFVQMLSLKTHEPPSKQDDPLWQSAVAADYVFDAHGSNLSRETYMLPALIELSRLTGKPKYKKAAVAFLKFYFKNCPSPTTHIWPWGEHMRWNLFTDRIHHWREEPEMSPAPWELFWQIDSSAVRREIEGFYTYHTYDKKNTFLFDRHANYYTGLFDDMGVRGAYIKHSGIYLYGFTFLWTKTHNPKYLRWMKKEADLYWNRRNPHTGLIPDEAKETSGVVAQTATLSYYLLLSYQLAPDQKYLLRYAEAYIRSFLKYTYNPENQSYFAGVYLRTGTPAWSAQMNVWQGNSVAAYLGKTVALLYKDTHDPFFLRHAERLADMIQRTPFSSNTCSGALGQNLRFFLNLYDLTGEGRYLRFSRKLASTAIDSLFDNGLFKHTFRSYVYNAGAANEGDHTGHLFAMLLRLYRTEKRLPLHWKSPRVWTKLGTPVPVRVFGESRLKNIRLAYRFGEGEKETLLKPVRKSGRRALFRIPFPPQKQGTVRFHFVLKTKSRRWRDSKNWVGLDTIWVRVPKAAPIIANVHAPSVVPGTEAIPVTFDLTCPAGIKQASVFFKRTGQPVREKMITRPLHDSTRVWVLIPAENLCFNGSTDFWLEAWGNPEFPVQARSRKFQVWASQKSEKWVSARPREQQAIEWPALNLKMTVQSARKTKLIAEKIPIPPVSSRKGLPAKGRVFYKFQTSGRGWPFTRAEAQISVPSRWRELFVAPTLSLFHWQKGSWTPMPSRLSDSQSELTAELPSAGLYTISGLPRQAWRWAAPEALLVSPAVGDLDGDGTLETVFASRDFGDFLTALHADGSEYWTIEKEGGFSFPVVADLDADHRPEVIVGDMDGYLYVLNGDGSLKWRYFAGIGIKTPAVGDLDGDGLPEIVCGLKNGDVLAVSNRGKKLWQTPTVPPEKRKAITLANQAFGGHSPVEKTIPALADLDGDGTLETVIAGRDSLLWAFDFRGNPLWKVALIGRCDYGPAVGDLNGDGKKEAVINSRRGGEKAKVYAVSAAGKILWSVPCDAYGDWSVSLADVDGDGKLDVVANDTSAALNVINWAGKIIRRIPLKSWNTVTPAVTDLTGDGKPDFVVAGNEERKVHVLDNSGRLLWSFQPSSVDFSGAKAKGGGNVAIADVNGDGKLDILLGDDESWFYDLRTQTACKPFAIRVNNYHNNPAHTGVFR